MDQWEGVGRSKGRGKALGSLVRIDLVGNILFIEEMKLKRNHPKL